MPPGPPPRSPRLRLRKQRTTQESRTRWEKPSRHRPGPPGGAFYLQTSGEDSPAEDAVNLTASSFDSIERRRDKRKTKDRKYGHQEDDLDYFRGVFREEQMELQKLELGDDFRYPSDPAFARYFPEYDFLKAMKDNGL